MSEPKLLSIWTCCGALVACYGALLTGIGIYYVVRPETATATAELNASLWWGAVMVVAGIALLVGPKLANRRGGTSDREEEGR